MSVAAITIVLYIFVFLFGIVIGSFLNVCIYRIPLKESIVFPHSHCMTCGYQLRWYDLVPLFSFLFLRGRPKKKGTWVCNEALYEWWKNKIFTEVKVGGRYFSIMALCAYGMV